MDGPVYHAEPSPLFREYARDTQPWYRSVRARIFLLVSGLVLLSGLIYALLQPVLYRSSASVLLSAPIAVDAGTTESDIQHVEIQRKVLLSGDILREVSDELADRWQMAIDVMTLRGALRVESVPETNLVDVAAYGPEAADLPLIVSTWVDVYEGARQRSVSESKQSTAQQVEEELTALSGKLEDARAALRSFRAENEIISAERQENEVLSRLEGVNNALNTALEEEVLARADLEAMREAVAKGDRVAPAEEERGLERLATELQALKGQMAAYERRFTDQYIERDPKLKAMRDRIEVLELEMHGTISDAQNAALRTAEQRSAAASRAASELKQQQREMRENVARFSNIFSTHEAMVADLESLEELYRETQARLVLVQTSGVERYPQVDVIDRPRAALRVGPDYLLIAGISLAIAFLAGVVTVWLYGFLQPKDRQNPVITLSGINIYPAEDRVSLPGSANRDQRLEPSRQQSLGHSHSNPTEPGPDTGDRDEK